MAKKKHHVVVDGSNLATEGRTLPSLAQLDEAVRAYSAEDPEAEIVVVVDASFGHRISEEERKLLEQAELLGEVVSPPAGAIGRGDAFVLRIAERTGAIVLSNDSFQEFHGEHPWLFEEGRLIGGKPVPGVGWIFTPRIPVRGAKSRQATDKAKRSDKQGQEAAVPAPVKAAELAKAARRVAKKAARVNEAEEVAAPAKKAPKPVKAAKKKVPSAKKASEPAKKAGAAKGAATKAEPAKKAMAKKKAPEVARKTKSATTKKVAKVAEESPALATTVSNRARRPRGGDSQLREAIVDATLEALVPSTSANEDKSTKTKRRRRNAAPPPAVNDPLAFITFVAAYPIGSMVMGEVASFTSHGAMVEVALPSGGVLHCYVPLSGLGSPPPIKAREVIKRGDRREFVLMTLDPPRRMAELSLPDVAATVDGAVAPR